MELKVDGQRTFAATGGRPFDPALPSIVFLHGAGMDRTVWALQTRYFAHHGWGVLAVDLPGHGRSEGKAPNSIAAAADWLRGVLSAAGLETAALAGHSMGALIALDFAARNLDRVRSLALLGAAEAMPVHPDLLEAARGNDHLAFELITSWGYGNAGHFGGAKVPGLWLLGGGKRLLARARPDVLHQDLAACNAYREAPARAEAVSCPTLLVLGAGDLMTPTPSGRKLAGHFTNARVEILADSGHMMILEKPDECLTALKGFF